MNKAELISNVAEKTELTKKDAEKAVNSMISVITETSCNRSSGNHRRGLIQERQGPAGWIRDI